MQVLVGLVLSLIIDVLHLTRQLVVALDNMREIGILDLNHLLLLLALNQLLVLTVRVVVVITHVKCSFVQVVSVHRQLRHVLLTH